jgi:hypothetical protein
MEFCDLVQRPNLPFARHCRVSAGRLRSESQTFRAAAALPSSLFEELVLSWRGIVHCSQPHAREAGDGVELRRKH